MQNHSDKRYVIQKQLAMKCPWFVIHMLESQDNGRTSINCWNLKKIFLVNSSVAFEDFFYLIKRKKIENPSEKSSTIL